MQLFTTLRDGYFDITATDAISRIKNDKQKTASQREEDMKFIEFFRENKSVYFGERDKTFKTNPITSKRKELLASYNTDSQFKVKKTAVYNFLIRSIISFLLQLYIDFI